MIIGLDVGGTHTDVVLLSDEGVVREVKVPTDAANLFQTVLTGLQHITAGIDPQRLHRMVLSTTLTTNAVVQQELPPVGLIVTGGPGMNPALWAVGSHYHVLPGALDHRGREIEPLDLDRVQALGEELAAQGIRWLGVVGKFSVHNPSHENQIRRQLDPLFERIFTGHTISGSLNFPRRITTTWLNAAVYAIHRKFFEAVQQSLVQQGLNIPIQLMKADGGTLSLAASLDYPAQTVLSGPASSVLGALAFAEDDEDALVLDIGGTTTDMAVLVNRAPVLAPRGIHLGEHKTLIRAINCRSIALGGDSWVQVQQGQLQIGPRRRGPALAYNGDYPTPTDALVISGRIKTGDVQRAREGYAALAAELKLSVEEAAARVLDLVCRRILAEAQALVDQINRQPVYTIHEMLEGYTVTPRKLLLIGAPAPGFARTLEELSTLPVGVVPRWSVANAIGAALARNTCEVRVVADTEQGLLTAPEEDYQERIDPAFTQADALKVARRLLTRKALQQGADKDELEMEILENEQFNMIRGFHTVGRSIRVKMQIKPGLIDAYDTVAGLLADV